MAGASHRCNREAGGGIVSRIEDARDSPAIKVSFTSSGLGWPPGSIDTGLAHLEGLKGLRELDLGSDKITDAGLERFRQVLPQVKINLRRPRRCFFSRRSGILPFLRPR